VDSGKNALVTGGAGFIGSNIANYLYRKGFSVRILDDLSTGSLDNLVGLDVEFIKGDVREAELVSAACEGRDVVFHLAACVGRQKSLDDPVQDASTNVLGTINVLEGMRKYRVPRIVYSSSAAIFGELLAPSIDEGHPQNCDSPYGVSKLAAEKMIFAYAGIYGIVGVCLRYFNIYGPNQRYNIYGNVIPIFAQRIYSHESLVIYGDGEQTRDFLNVHDVAKANYYSSLPSVEGGAINLGSGSTVTINQLASMMKDIAGSDTAVEYRPERPADVRHCKANVSKAKSSIGFDAEVDLRDGLVEYMRWFEDNFVK
jgi:nucleoside-diphosphate-sugar epimerase